jgi:hypothetical protein
MTEERMTVRSRGLSLDPPHIDASVELRNIPLGIFPGSGEATMTMFTLEQRVEILTQEIKRLERLIYSLSQQIESLQPGGPEEASDILDLQPLSRSRVNAKVRKYYEPARFRIIEDAEDTDPEDTEG